MAHNEDSNHDSQVTVPVHSKSKFDPSRSCCRMYNCYYTMHQLLNLFTCPLSISLLAATFVVC